MTFAEIIFFCIFVIVIYYLLIPVQKRLERWIYLRIKSRNPGSKKPVIDISDYKKNN
jgi:hypothetical protein